MNERPSSKSALELRQMLNFAGQTIIAREAYLNSLDAALGDGDHGITMRLGFQAIAKALGELKTTAGPDEILRSAGMSFMGATGGAIGVIFGKMLIAGSVPLRGGLEFGTTEFRLVLGEMERSVMSSGKVKVGDKTILDAVHAANLAVSGDEGKDMDLACLVSNAATAAERAARDTAGFICRVGRASRLGERSLGCPDPGAISFGIILRAMADCSANQSQRI
jgi:dihydroxyacetone kinase